MKHLCRLLPALALAFGCSAAFAHGNSSHDAHAPVRKEQKDWGIAADAKASQRRISVSMGDDMRFKPDRIEVRQGETVTLVIRNQGKLKHEFVLGTKAELDAHAEMMGRHPGMEHDEPYMAHVAPGKTGTLVWTFNRAGDFDFACLINGHFQAGMVGKVRVLPAGKPS